MPLPDAVRRLPLDDALRDLADLVGDARVVALGENNHHVREFTRLRDRMLRILVREAGFTVVAFESGCAEGHLVDDWLRGGPGDVRTVGRDGFTFRFGDFSEMHDMLRWLRGHNEAGGRVRFAGVDVPGSGGSSLPALRHVRRYLSTYHPGHLPLVEGAIEATACYRSANNGLASAAYAGLGEERRDAATAALSRLLLRVDALLPEPGPERIAHLFARHHALGALRLDEHLRELQEFGSPDAPDSLPSSRDVYQAETVRLLREVYGADARIVLMVHNAHAQRVPMRLVPSVLSPSAGSHLAASYGEDYVVMGLTACGGETTDTRLDEQAREGFEVVSRPLGPPAPGSVEEAVTREWPEGGPVMLDMRPARGQRGPSSIRHAYTDMRVDVPAAFDLLACLPAMQPSAFVTRTSSA